MQRHFFSFCNFLTSVCVQAYKIALTDPKCLCIHVVCLKILYEVCQYSTLCPREIFRVFVVCCFFFLLQNLSFRNTGHMSVKQTVGLLAQITADSKVIFFKL